MKFKIDPKIFDKYPGTIIGVVIVKEIDNSGSNDGIQELIAAEQTRIRANFDPETLSQTPKINCWRKAYAEFGCKPKDSRQWKISTNWLPAELICGKSTNLSIFIILFA
jgi:DNA/RNA-binding domain of Phe-tRNA-synthetase-like protein